MRVVDRSLVVEGHRASGARGRYREILDDDAVGRTDAELRLDDLELMQGRAGSVDLGRGGIEELGLDVARSPFVDVRDDVRDPGGGVDAGPRIEEPHSRGNDRHPWEGGERYERLGRTAHAHLDRASATRYRGGEGVLGAVGSLREKLLVVGDDAVHVGVQEENLTSRTPCSGSARSARRPSRSGSSGSSRPRRSGCACGTRRALSTCSRCASRPGWSCHCRVRTSGTRRPRRTSRPGSTSNARACRSCCSGRSCHSGSGSSGCSRGTGRTRWSYDGRVSAGWSSGSGWSCGSYGPRSSCSCRTSSAHGSRSRRTRRSGRSNRSDSGGPCRPCRAYRSCPGCARSSSRTTRPRRSLTADSGRPGRTGCSRSSCSGCSRDTYTCSSSRTGCPGSTTASSSCSRRTGRSGSSCSSRTSRTSGDRADDLAAHVEDPARSRRVGNEERLRDISEVGWLGESEQSRRVIVEVVDATRSQSREANRVTARLESEVVETWGSNDDAYCLSVCLAVALGLDV